MQSTTRNPRAPRTPRVLAAALLILGSSAMTARSDEGMWLPNDPPRKLLRDKYGFDLTDAWLERAMKGSVRFNNGGSGGFVSPDALIVTNHHIAADSLQKLSTPDRDLYHAGFYAKARAEELKCPDLELNVLESIEDVTGRVNAAVKPGGKPADAAAARRAVMSEIEKDSLARTGLRSDVVTFYHGGLYHLYRYKKYTDVRLVFAPEHAIAFFGGDTDNFEFPRFNLDVAFFRAYEDGKPAKVERFFRWSKVGPVENDLVFVTGHPGTTQRLETLAKLIHRRDVTLPYDLYRLRTMEAALTQYAEQSSERRRQAATDLHRVANARKAFSGQYQGLLDPRILDKKRVQEADLTAQLGLAGEKTLRPEDVRLKPWVTIADVQTQYEKFEKEHNLYERGDAFACELVTFARHCVRLADEMPKPSAERLREYRDSNLESLKFSLFSPAPVYPALQRAKLTSALTFLAENLGGKHPLVVLALDGKPPYVRAEELVNGSRLIDPAERKKLVDGGKASVEASDDAMVRFARAVDAEARKLRKRFEEEVEEPERQAYAEIARLRFQALGRTVPPDATFTLRLAFGTVKGYRVGNEVIPSHTTFGGAFAKAEQQKNIEPYTLPPRWLEGKEKLDPLTPFDFVSTADTIGGNSGSPVLNRAGELVGINFDRNRYGLVRNFVYTDEQARHIAVHSRAVLEALRRLYDAGPLAGELAGKE
jgi:hypothetical protein